MLKEPAKGIGALYVDVHEFHRVFDHPAHFSPVLQPADRVTARADWLDEEVGELREAKTIAEQADAYIDIIYFAVGGLVEMGVDPSELWRIVHGANMAKVQPDGSVKRREDGKIIKPEGWCEPDADIAMEIMAQIDKAEHSPLFDTPRRKALAQMTADAEEFEDDGTMDRLRTLHESGRAAVRAAMGESLLREPSKAPVERDYAPDPRFKPRGFA